MQSDFSKLATILAGEAIELCALRALHWPRERTLFVADVHLGKDAVFRAGGIPLPAGAAATDLARLTALLDATAATRLVVLGDLIHGKSGRVEALDREVLAWRTRHASLDVLLIRGNHDDHAGDPPATWRIDCVDGPLAMGPFLACHEPPASLAVSATSHALCGHVHPGVVICSASEPSLRLPCFVVGRRRTILPAFGRLTGLMTGVAAPGDRVVAIAGSGLVALPAAA